MNDNKPTPPVNEAVTRKPLSSEALEHEAELRGAARFDENGSGGASAPASEAGMDDGEDPAHAQERTVQSSLVNLPPD